LIRYSSVSRMCLYMNYPSNLSSMEKSRFFADLGENRGQEMIGGRRGALEKESFIFQ
jgi:hypothetical protein